MSVSMSSPRLPTHRRFATRLFNSLAALSSPDPRAGAGPDDHDASPLDGAPDALRKQLLALQVLFPNEFVPALDVLDRRLVTRLRVVSDEDAHHEDDDAVMQLRDEGGIEAEEETHTSDDTDKATTPGTLPITTTTPTAHQRTSTNDTTTTTVYYVQSAQHHRAARYTTPTASAPIPSYQVRLPAWSCSCPAFTFSAFPARASPDTTASSSPAHDNNDDDDMRAAADDNDNTWVFGGIALDPDMPPVCKHLLACVLAERCEGLFGAGVRTRCVGVREEVAWAAGWAE